MIYVILGSLLVIVARTMELISPRTIKKKKKKEEEEVKHELYWLF